MASYAKFNPSLSISVVSSCVVVVVVVATAVGLNKSFNGFLLKQFSM